MFELIYTSTPQGLITGRSGFTTVALTEGFPPNLIAPIENMSGYKTLFPPGNEYEQYNPVNYSCQHYRFGSTLYIVLSRISYAGLSYTGRSNVLAHHLLFTKEELAQIPGGAVSVLRAPENFTPFSGKPGMLPLKSLKQIRYAYLSSGQSVWKKLTGDQNWAQHVAECFQMNRDETKSLAFDPLKISAEEILALISETASCLRKEELHDFTFSTYSYSSGITNPLFLRAYVKDSLQLDSIRRMNPDSIIELGGETVLPAPPLLSAPRSTDQETEIFEEEEEESVLPGIPLSDLHNGEDLLPGIRSIEEDPAAAESEEDPEQAEYFSVNDSPGEEDADEEDIRSIKRRNILFITVLILLTLLLCGAVVYRIISGNRPPARPDGTKTSAETIRVDQNIIVKEKITHIRKHSPRSSVSGGKESLHKEEGIEDFLPRSAKEKKSEKNAGKTKALPPRKKPMTVSAAVVARPRKAETVRFGKLRDQEIFELYKNFLSSYSFTLPRSLRNASAMELKLRAIGGRNKDIKDLNKFTAGSGSRKLLVYPRKEKNNGYTISWEPDPSGKGIMTLSLDKHGVLTVEIDPSHSRNPGLADIEKITFLSGKGERFDFQPHRLPDCIGKILNRDFKQIRMKKSEKEFQLYFKITDEFRIFSKYYYVAFNNSRREINKDEAEFHIVTISFQEAERLIRERNEALEKKQNARKNLQQFSKSHEKELAVPRLNRKNLKKLPSEIQKEIQEAVQDPDTDWDEFPKDLEERLKTLKKEKESKAILKDLDRYREKIRKRKKCLDEQVKLEENLQKTMTLFRQKHQSMKKGLESRATVLYKKYQQILKHEFQHLDIEKCFDITLKELTEHENIKIEIIRR